MGGSRRADTGERRETPPPLAADTNRAYQVAVPGLIERSGDLTRAIEIARVHYRQEAIFVSYLGQAEIIGPPA